MLIACISPRKAESQPQIKDRFGGTDSRGSRVWDSCEVCTSPFSLYQRLSLKNQEEGKEPSVSPFLRERKKGVNETRGARKQEMKETLRG